jgi:hypothetical protein
MEIWLKVIVTALIVGGFVLSVVGAWRLLTGSQAGVARMTNDREVRDSLRDQLRVAQAAAEKSDDRDVAMQAALRAWTEGHSAAGLEAHTIKSLNDGREFLAERIILELGASTRTDVRLVLVGVSLGLAASLLDVWAL